MKYRTKHKIIKWLERLLRYEQIKPMQIEYKKVGISKVSYSCKVPKENANSFAVNYEITSGIARELLKNDAITFKYSDLDFSADTKVIEGTVHYIKFPN